MNSMNYLEPVSESYISEVISKSTAKSSWLDPPPTTVVKQSAGARADKGWAVKRARPSKKV